MCVFRFLITFSIFAHLLGIKYSLTRLVICISLHASEAEPLFLCSSAVCISSADFK